MLPISRRNSNRIREIWDLRIKRKQKVPPNQRTKDKDKVGNSRKPTKATSKEQHHEDEEGHKKVV
jgi:hypothetical protein